MYAMKKRAKYLALNSFFSSSMAKDTAGDAEGEVGGTVGAGAVAHKGAEGGITGAGVCVDGMGGGTEAAALLWAMALYTQYTIAHTHTHTIINNKSTSLHTIHNTHKHTHTQ